eukprot:8207811-Lingulodinium_polyedra.AAC.1
MGLLTWGVRLSLAATRWSTIWARETSPNDRRLAASSRKATIARSSHSSFNRRVASSAGVSRTRL